jgi:hypothetical protein
VLDNTKLFCTDLACQNKLADNPHVGVYSICITRNHSTAPAVGSSVAIAPYAKQFPANLMQILKEFLVSQHQFSLLEDIYQAFFAAPLKLLANSFFANWQH